MCVHMFRIGSPVAQKGIRFKLAEAFKNRFGGTLFVVHIQWQIAG